MTIQVSITPNGRMSLPAEIRKRLGVASGGALLVEETQRLFTTYPRLSSNRITRAMQKQLQMAHEPRGACRQQGLHYIYSQTCREKLCEQCIVGRERL